MTENKKVKFKSWDCFLELGYYGAGGRLAIQLLSSEEDADKGVFYGEPIAVATVNLPEVTLKENELIIKNYSENEGMLETLKNAGFITNVKREITSGFTTVQGVEKTPKLILLENQKKSTIKMKK